MSHGIQQFSEEEQEKLLKDCSSTVKAQGYYMKRCLDAHKLMDALKHASNMIAELRTSMLSPKNYYHVYCLVFDELNLLEQYLVEEQKRGKRIAELYEVVQYAGNILPRLYLLVTVGSVYIRSQEAPAKDILRDMVEMCRGVQHPTRGLFLRNYLLTLCKDKLPDTNSAYIGKGGDVNDSVDFILLNFVEMNKLWVRLQHQGAVKDRQRRETERKDLQLLVGTNLRRLSDLEGVTPELYENTILPSILEEIIRCKDVISQEYIMEIISRVFPDHFHLRTIDQFLGACTQLQSAVDLRRIITSLIDRLANYIKTTENKSAIPDDLFATFSSYVNKVIQSRPKMPMSDMLALQGSLLSLVLSTNPDRIDYVDGILEFTTTILGKLPEKRLESSTCISLVKQMLMSPLATYKNILTVLDLSHYGKTLEYLDFYTRRDVAVALCNTAIRYHKTLEDPEKVHFLFTYVNVLLEDQDDFSDAIYDDEDFAEDLVLTAKLVNLLYSESPETMYSLLKVAKSHLKNGGERRVRSTMLPLLFRSLMLTNLIEEANGEEEGSAGVASQKAYKFMSDCVTAVSEVDAFLGIKMMLQCAQNAASLSYEDIAYDFMEQAFLVYEGENEIKWQYDAVVLMISSLQAMSGFSTESYEALAQSAAGYAIKLLRKPDQSKAVCLATHLYWTAEDSDGEGGYHDAKTVLKLLQKSMRVADKWVDPKVQFQLFAEILNRFLYYFEAGNEEVAEYVNQLIELIDTKMESYTEAAEDLDEVKDFVSNTMRYVKSKQEGEEAAKWKAIVVGA